MRNTISGKATLFTIFLFIAYLFLIFIFPIQAHSADVTLAWNKNLEGNIAGYRLFSRLNNQGYDFMNPDWEGSETQCTLYGLKDSKDYFFVVRAFSIAGYESRNSNEVSYNSAYKTISQYSNKPPIADAGPNQVEGKNETVFLNGLNSFDPDDSIVSYRWTQIKGTPVALNSSSNAKIQFAAPEIVKDETLVFKLTVTDNQGNQSSDTCFVTITENNIPPSSEAGATQTVSPGDFVVLDGSDSFDPDDGILYYKWIQLTGRPAKLSNPYDVKTSFIAHDVESKGEALVFELQVTDKGGLFSTDTVVVNITGGGIPPLVETISGQEVFEGDTVILDTYRVVDPSDSELIYKWKQIEGPAVVFSETDSMAPSFVAPQVDRTAAILVFVLSVENADGLVGTTEITVAVKEKGDFGFPNEAVPFTSAYGDMLGVKIKGDGSLTRIDAIFPEEIDDSFDSRTESMMYGLFEMEIRVARPDDKVSVIFFLPGIVPESCQFYKYSDNEGGWYDFTENVSFSSSRDQMVMTLTDGGTGDDDDTAGRIIIDPSGLAFGSGYRRPLGVSSDNGSSGGCFIGAGIEEVSPSFVNVKAAFKRWARKISSILHSFNT
ncbi:MAG: choice-of-anchor U domain-containing protein [Desulfobacterales bacterium]